MARYLSTTLFFAALSLAGCGDDSTTDAGAVDTGTDSPTVDASAGLGICTFVLLDGANRIPWEGTVRARMNGSGNLLAVCESNADDSELELRIGNATFDGPRIYRMDDFTSDGSIQYDDRAGLGGFYDSSRDGASCTLDLTEAGPLDARGDSVIPGGRVSATFVCAALIDLDGMPGSYVLEDGVFAAQIE